MCRKHNFPFRIKCGTVHAEKHTSEPVNVLGHRDNVVVSLPMPVCMDNIEMQVFTYLPFSYLASLVTVADEQ